MFRMIVIFVSVLLMVAQESEPKECGISGHQNPLYFWTLIPGAILDGKLEHKVTSNESVKMIKSIAKKTLSQNKVSMSTKVSVGGVLKAFNVGAEFSASYEHFASKTTDELTSEENQMATSMQTTYHIPAGEVFLTISEMKMFVYKSTDGKSHSLVLPTGTLIVGATNKDKLENQILDNTFRTLVRRKIFQGIKTHTRKELQGSIETSAYIPTVEQVEQAQFPAPNTYYREVDIT